MTNTINEQRARLYELAGAARPKDDDDWGSERQITASNLFHVYVSDELGVGTEDMATAKATSDELIDEALRRAEQHLLCQEYAAWIATTGFEPMCARELQHELMSDESAIRGTSKQLKWVTDFADRWERWEQWKMWYPKPEA